VTSGALLALLALAAGGDPLARFAEGNLLLSQGDAERAARVYEALLDEGLESPALHVNLGRARFLAGRRGEAVASFERALRLDPRDADARANLAFVRGRDLDRPDPSPERSFLARIVERTPDAWAAAAFAAPWVSLFALLALRRRAEGRPRAALGALAALSALASIAGGALLAGRAAERRAAVAVVIAPEAAVREGPEEALRPAFRVPEGAAVRLLEARDGAARVRLENGLEGWMRERDLERLARPARPDRE
jgi:tetratricopeptide (TPR) repeat protein